MKRIVLALLVVATISASAEDLRPPPAITVSLKLEPISPVVGDPVLVRIVVENGGDKPIRLFRLRAGDIEQFASSWGWTLDVNGPGGKYNFIHIPKPRLPMQEEDIIELRPGESFGLKLYLVGIPLVKGDPRYKRLGETEGKYSVKLMYKLDEQVFNPKFVKIDHKEVFLGPLSSEILEFEIKKRE